MEQPNAFRVIAWWTAGRTGIARSSSAPNALHFTSPPAFGGLEGRWTPEDFLLCAIASCYTTTLRTLAEYSKFVYTDLQVEAESTIKKAEVGYKFTTVFIRTNLTIAQEEERPQALKLLNKAKELCLVSRALSLELKFEPHIQVGESLVETDHALPASHHEERH